MRATTPAACIAAKTPPASTSPSPSGPSIQVTEKAKRQPCSAAKDTARAVSGGSARWRRSAHSGCIQLPARSTARGPKACAGFRSASSPALSGWMAPAASSATATVTTSAASQPNRSATAAVTRPAHAPPSGAPACFTEKTSVRCPFGAAAARMRLPAGGDGP